MATLTESALVARKAIKYGVIGFIGITILWFVSLAAIRYYKILFPPAPPSPEVGFGKLKAIKFPEEQGRPDLALELPTGAIPDFPDRMIVYSSPLKRSNFLDASQAIETATKMGFTFKPSELSKTKYVWINQDALSSKLETDIVTGQFVMTRQWQNNPGLASLNDYLSDRQVINDAIGVLRKYDLLPDDILGEERVSYLRADAGKLVAALALADADFIQVDFYRQNKEEIEAETKEVLASYPFYRPRAGLGLMRVILSGSKEVGEKIIYFENKYVKIDYDRFSTYPVKTGEEAWAELEQGGGYVTDDGPKSGTIKIRRIFLAYYDGGTEDYTMPIYVFLGDKNFVGYVSAIRPEWLEE